MTHNRYGALIASLSVIALMLPASEAFARSGAAPRAAFASTHPVSRPLLAHSLRHHRRHNAFWPGFADSYYGPTGGEPMTDVAPPASGDVRYTYTHDVPWDWAHRYPPAVAPGDRPYVSSCPAETVTVSGRDGQDQTVNVIRCY